MLNVHAWYIYTCTYIYVYNTHTFDFQLSLSLFSLVPWKWPKVSGHKTHLCLSDPYFISLCRVIINCSKNLSICPDFSPTRGFRGEVVSMSFMFLVKLTPCERRTEAWDPGWLCEGAALCLLRLCRDPHNSPFVLKASISASTYLLGFLSCFLFSRLLSSS